MDNDADDDDDDDDDDHDLFVFLRGQQRAAASKFVLWLINSCIVHNTREFYTHGYMHYKLQRMHYVQREHANYNN